MSIELIGRVVESEGDGFYRTRLFREESLGVTLGAITIAAHTRPPTVIVTPLIPPGETRTKDGPGSLSLQYVEIPSKAQELVNQLLAPPISVPKPRRR